MQHALTHRNLLTLLWFHLAVCTVPPLFLVFCCFGVINDNNNVMDPVGGQNYLRRVSLGSPLAPALPCSVLSCYQ